MVYHHQNPFRFGIRVAMFYVFGADKGEDRIVHEDILLLAGLESGVLGAKTKQAAGPVEDIGLLGGASDGGEGAGAVSGKASRKTAGKIVTVFGVAAAAHGDFVAGVDSRHSAHGGDEGEGDLEIGYVRTGFAQEARRVMVADEGHKPLRVRIEAILAQHIFKFAHGRWTADGRYFVFQSTRDGDSNLWQLDDRPDFLSHRGPVQITNGPLSYQAPITSRDGDRIFFIGLNTRSELLSYDAQASSFVPNASDLSNARRVEFSRDQKWVAWIQPDDGSLWRSRLDGSQREGGHLQPLLNENRNEADPDWSPDGKAIVFERLPELMAEESQPKAIYLLNVNTKQMQQLPASEGLFSPRLSPDGRYIAALSLDQTKLMLYDTVATTWRTLALENIADPAWSHDGTAIFFHDFVQEGQPIYKLTLADGHMEHVAGLRDLRSADVVDYRFAGLAPGDIPLVNARMSTANIYSARSGRDESNFTACLILRWSLVQRQSEFGRSRLGIIRDHRGNSGFPPWCSRPPARLRR